MIVSVQVYKKGQYPILAREQRTEDKRGGDVRKLVHGSLGAVEDVGTEHTGKGSLTVRRETCENKDEYSERVNTTIGVRTVSLDTLLLGSSHVTPPTNLQENGPVSTVKHHLPSRPSFIINPLPPRAPRRITLRFRHPRISLSMSSTVSRCSWQRFSGSFGSGRELWKSGAKTHVVLGCRWSGERVTGQMEQELHLRPGMPEWAGAVGLMVADVDVVWEKREDGCQSE